ncbi:TonB-dependent receptor [Pseudohongiella spirulinae]|uniref:TonB-dependent receptor-like protein n=1 Tax=Pseudohongiella spirulinae TaxID=1249552 RepID=A0A0S2KAC1_9GAMM|nr:TonB-dependent receptor [Pseudohongiella spirulinae]ALO45011.1 TonB-dependent receptor-like protein [Pseudohongiella spirulinae]
MSFCLNKKQCLLATAIASALAHSLISVPALAQENSAPEVTEVVTYGTPIRDSQRAAIEEKRNADNYLDVVSADTIGRFPDQNLADSLGRMPGLAIERDQGQARYINFRGAPFRYTQLAIDGLSIPGAENGRVPRFDAFPSVITRRIEANKAITPDMPGEAVSGYINIDSFNPFEVDGWSAATDFGIGEQRLGGGDVSRYSGRLSWSGETLGFSLFASENLREQITDNREYDLEWDNNSRERILNSIDYRSYFVDRRDSAYGGRLEYRPADTMNRFFFSTLFSEFVDDEERNQYVVDFETGANAIRQPQATGDNGYQPLVLTQRLLQLGEYENSVLTNTLGADVSAGGWFIEARINLTNTESSLFLPIPLSAGGQAAAEFDISNLEDPRVTLMAPFTRTPITAANISFPVNLGIIVDSGLDIDASKLKLDAERNMELFGRDATVKLGLEHDQREGRGAGFAIAQTAFPQTLNINDFDTGARWESDMNNTVGGTVYDNQGLFRAWEQAVGGISVPVPADQRVAIDEDITAIYAMAKSEFDWGNIVAGMRVERTDYSSEGPIANYADTLTHALPSAHINIDLREDLKLRLAATTSISRPTYNEWRAAASVNLVDRIVTGGNPSLEPEEAAGLDVSLEWYAGDASLVSLGAFHRNIENVIYADSATIDGGVYVPSAAGENWSYTGFINGRDGKLSGVEFNLIAQLADFMPSALDGLGFNANITLLDSKFKTRGNNSFSLPGTSDVIYNTSVYYETERLSLRINYQYRDDWLSTTENDAFAEYWAAQKRLDLNVKYDLPWQVMGADLSVYFNANNLNDAVDVRYVENARTPNQVERYGRHYMTGIRANF